jgi:UDP-glucose 4-epimerase
MAILVTGGAGYIGSHTVAELLERHEDVVIIDNLQKGHKRAIIGGVFYQGNLADDGFMDKVFKERCNSFCS